MTCPICNSDMIVDTLYGTSNPKIVIQGYVCDDCGHDWEAIKQLEIMTKLSIEEEKADLKKQELLLNAAAKEAELEIKGQDVNLKALQNSAKDETTKEIKKMEALTKLIEKENKDA